MKIKVSRHIFGSIRGYTTLAKSKDLSPEETANLEILSFGQTNELSYLDSLQKNPAYISRPLHAEKWAITRVFKGKPDEHNRITLLFISAVITIDNWLYSLKCDVNKLLYYPGLWQWNGEEKLEPIEITFESKREIPGPEIRNKVLSLLGAVEKYTIEENTAIVVRASDYDAKVLRWLNMVLPLSSKRTFSCVARSLNDGLPVALISMARDGSFGNSRRKTVNWTLTSVVDDCPYADSLAEFWQAQDHPPWQFIDSCKSFLTGMREELEPLPQKRLARERVLFTKVEVPKTRQKTYFSRKLKVTLFTCAVIVGLATVITVELMHFKTKRKVRSLIETKIREAHSFVVENASNKFFTKDEHARPEIIKEGRRLQNELEKNKDLPELAEDVVLKTQLNAGISELKDWYNVTQTENQRHNVLEGLFRQTNQLKLNVPPYPTKETISRVVRLKKSIKANIEKAKYLAQNSRPRQNSFEEGVSSWYGQMKIFLLKKKREVTTAISGLPKKPPFFSSKEQYGDYERLMRILEKLRKDETWRNALSSPIEDDQEIAKGMSTDLDNTLANCNERIRKMLGFEKKAETLFGEAVRILGNLKITDDAIDNFDGLKDVQSHLDKVAELWPDKPNLEDKNKEANDRFKTNKKKILARWKEDKEVIDNLNNAVKEVTADELIKEYKEVKTLLEGATLEILTDDDIQRLKAFDGKLSKRSSISKQKKQESNQNE
ncbi:MAG: hypothetical protein ACYSWZ_05060 [Planctomycetota bacterium]|jgi:hypothetical protein